MTSNRGVVYLESKKALFWLLLLAATLGSGCKTYVYRVVRPPGIAQPIADQPVTIPYDPLEYRLSRRSGRLDMRIDNPTDDRIVLLGNRSYAIDPRGESHPLRSRVIASHSYTGMLLPPEPKTVTVYDWGWGWGWGWGPFLPGDPFFVDFYAPPVYYARIVTPYDWEWHKGTAIIHLTYERKGKTFDHEFEIVREPEKK